MNLTLKTEAQMDTDATDHSSTTSQKRKSGDPGFHNNPIVLNIKKHSLPCNPPHHPPNGPVTSLISDQARVPATRRKGPLTSVASFPSPAMLFPALPWLLISSANQKGFSTLFWPVSQRDLYLVLI